MNTWIFQGNPQKFDIDRYLVENPIITWAIRQQHLVEEIEIGDKVFIWRSDGKKKGSGGIVAEAEIIGLPKLYTNKEESTNYWNETVEKSYLAAELKVIDVRISDVLSRKALLEHNDLTELPIMKFKQNTNYLLTKKLSKVLNLEWQNKRREEAIQFPIQVSRENAAKVLSIPASSTTEIIENYQIHAFPHPRPYDYSNLVTFRKAGGVMTALYKVEDKVLMDVRNGIAAETIEHLPKDVQARLRAYVRARTEGFGFEERIYEFWILHLEENLLNEPQTEKVSNSHVYYYYKDIISGKQFVTVSSKLPKNKKNDYIEDFKREMDEAKKVSIEETEKEQITKARIGQSSFKKALLTNNKKCTLCGVSDELFLIASHIKPWAASNGSERLDVENGLLLCPNHDHLFDRGFISFQENGQIIISPNLDENTKKFMNVQAPMKIEMSTNQRKYMNWHLENIFNFKK